MNSSIDNTAIGITLFEGAKNEIGKSYNTTWSGIRDWLNQQSAVVAHAKDFLPLIKLAIFENDHRSNENLRQVYGIEADYDGELLQISQAVEILHRAGIESLIYTSPSHTDARPRFRVLCPLSKSCAPQERNIHMARLNGVFGGVLAAESFTLSQSYYFGSVTSGNPMQCYHVPGAPIDKMPDLPSIGKRETEISRRVNGQRVNGGMKAPNYNIALEALQGCPVDCDRDDWLLISGAFYTATEGLESEAKRLADWQAWNSSYKTDNPSKNLRDWKDFKNNSTSGDFSTLVDMSNSANAKGWALFGSVEYAVPEKHERNKFYFTRWDQLETTEQAWIIEGVIPEGLSLLFGASGVGKSFVAISIGMSLAAGVPWLGHVIRIAGDVIYICGEGKANIKKRMMAWNAHYGRGISAIPFYVSSERVYFPEATSIAQVKRAIEALGIKPKLIIIDTFSRNFVGNENETQDMTGFVRAIDDLKDRYGASVLIIHHTGHGEKDRARGSGALKGAMDAEYLIDKTKTGQIVFRCTKMKDAEEPRDKTFELAPVVMLTDGFPQTGVVLASAASSPIHLSPQLTKAVNALQTIKNELSEDDLLHLFIKEGVINAKPENHRRIFRKILSDFQKKSLHPQWVGKMGGAD